LDTRWRPLIANAKEREVRAKVAAVQRDSSSLDAAANAVGDCAEVLLRYGADPSDPRVARIRKKSAAAKLSFEARNASEAFLHAFSERRQERFRLFAEKGERQVLRLGAHPRRRRQLRFHHRNAVADRAELLLRKGDGDEEAHWMAG